MIFPLNNNKNKSVAIFSLLSFELFASVQSSQDVTPLTQADSYSTPILTLMLILAGALCFLLIKHKSRQSINIDKLDLALWAYGDELWHWNINKNNFSRTSQQGTFYYPSIEHDKFPFNPDRVHPQDLNRLNSELKQYLDGESELFKCRYRAKKNGKWSWVENKGQINKRNQTGKPLEMSGSLRCIQSHKSLEQDLQLFVTSLNNINDGLMILDPNLNIIKANKGFLTLFDSKSKQLIGKKLSLANLDPSEINNIKSIVDEQNVWRGEISFKRNNKELFPIFISANAIKDNRGQVSYYVVIISDISKQKKDQAKLLKLSKNDKLTGLPNRTVFFEHVQHCLDSKTPLALLVFDLDDFKKINDSLGHHLGDELLQLIAKQITPIIDHRSTLYRLGGDEFAILIRQTNDIYKITLLARQILEELSTPFHVQQHEFILSASIGIVLSPDDGKQSQALLQNADTAMYKAKEKSNRYMFFNDEMNKKAVTRLQVENLIRQGLKEDYFHVYYQPKLCLKTNQLVGMEALVRFITPNKGLISPATFIPIAEESGQVVEIGEVVLRKACKDMQRWLTSGLFSGRVAVNLSAKQFNERDLLTKINDIISETGLSPEHLELEITEGTVIDDPDYAIEVMEQLRKLGIHIALDDFGTGYSSLTYLRKFPLNTLKIDKAFIDDSDSNAGKSMISTIVTIANNLGLSTVAEGVETIQQQQIISEMDCDVLQGYLYSKPLTSAEFEQFAVSQHTKTN